MEKKKWEKPMLIVLVRGEPEEAVLADCKIDGNSGYLTACWITLGDPCNTRVLS